MPCASPRATLPNAALVLGGSLPTPAHRRGTTSTTTPLCPLRATCTLPAQSQDVPEGRPQPVFVRRNTRPEPAVTVRYPPAAGDNRPFCRGTTNSTGPCATSRRRLTSPLPSVGVAVLKPPNSDLRRVSSVPFVRSGTSCVVNPRGPASHCLASVLPRTAVGGGNGVNAVGAEGCGMSSGTKCSPPPPQQTATPPGRSLRDQIFFFLLRTAPRDHQPPTANSHQPPTATNRQPPTATNRQPPTAANRQRRPTANCQPLPTATNHQSPITNRRQPPPTATNRHQPPITNHQPPPTTTNRHQPPVADRQPPTANRQPPTATNHG